MAIFVTSIHVVLCLFLIVVVLLQTGKGADMGAAFGGASQTVFGATGAVSILHKVTTVTAVMFMLTSLGLAWHSARSQAGGGGLDSSIFDEEKQNAEEEDEATDTPAEAEATDTPAQAVAPATGDVEPPAEEAAEAAPAEASDEEAPVEPAEGDTP
jgi:preprotein translocase subunit SecG